MKTILVQPYGYCFGVRRAQRIALEAAKTEPVYCLGSLVHNELAIKELSAQGVKTIQENGPDLAPLLELAPKGSLILFSAHGHDKALESQAHDLGLRYLDATCPYVQANIEFGLRWKGSIAYIGTKGHAEAEAFCRNVHPLAFFDAKSGELVYAHEGSLQGVIAQTTLDTEDIDLGLKAIEEKYGPVRLLAGRCPATEQRQAAVEAALQVADCLIVLGSKTSSNSRRLLTLAKKKGKAGYLVLDLAELRRLDLSSFSTVALCSGASTSNEEVERCYAYLSSDSTRP